MSNEEGFTFYFQGTRPESIQSLTLKMMQRAKENNYFVDAREFKTKAQYTFDSMLFNENSLFIVSTYIESIRPLLGPCTEDDYLLVNTNGKQYKIGMILSFTFGYLYND